MSALDANLIDELRVLMEDDFSVLLDAYLSEAPVQRAAIESAHSDSSSDQLKRAAHSLKGSSSNIGASGLANICAELEAFATSDFEATHQLMPRLALEYDRVFVEVASLKDA